MKKANLLIFGGTAAYSIKPKAFAHIAETITLDTPYGRSPQLHKLMTKQGTAVWYGSRHGENSLARSARFVNHRANFWAAQQLGVHLVLSWNGVGAINPQLHVGDLIIPTALMDWTRHRHHSFGDAARYRQPAHQWRIAARTIEHINNGRQAQQTATPFQAQACQQIKAVLAKQQITPKLTAPTYVCTEGPRLETAAEIQLAADLGADVVGMTLCPEVWLAAEMGLGYASLCFVTNFATGRWHIDPRREFGPGVAQRALLILLAVADRYRKVHADYLR